MKHMGQRWFREWLMIAVVAFIVMEIANLAFPGHRMSLTTIVAAILAGTTGMLSYLLGKAALVRTRSRRRADGA